MLIGLSLGGPTAIAYTARHPHSVAWPLGIVGGTLEIDAATESLHSFAPIAPYRFAGDEPTVPDGATDFSASMSA